MRFVSFSDDHRTENQFILRYRYTTVVAYALVERCNNVVLFVRLPPLFLFFVRRSPQNCRPRPASCRSVRFPVFNNTTNIVDVLFPLHYYPRVSLRTCKRYYWHNRSKKKKTDVFIGFPSWISASRTADSHSVCLAVLLLLLFSPFFLSSLGSYAAHRSVGAFTTRTNLI